MKNVMQNICHILLHSTTKVFQELETEVRISKERKEGAKEWTLK